MSSSLQGTVAGVVANLAGTINVANFPASQTVRVNGSGSGDLARPEFVVCQAFSQVITAVAAGATVALMTPVAGIYIEDLSISCSVIGTTAASLALHFADNATDICQILVSAPTVAAGTTITGLLRKYLSPNVAGPLTFRYSALPGANGFFMVNFTYATTSQQGP